MKIEVWSDFVCPFCYIGKRKLELALERVGKIDEVEVVYKSFQLNPDAKKHYEESIDELIANKYGISIERASASNRGIVAAAKEVGLTFDFEHIKPTNTSDAHRLSHYAKDEGQMEAFAERLMRDYFTNSVNISDTEVLLKAIEDVGLDSDRAAAIINSSEYSDKVNKDVEEARQLGISGVPYFVFNEKTVISGAQAIEVFEHTIKELL